MAGLPNRCSGCLETMINGCDIYYVLLKDSLSATSDIYSIGISHDSNVGRYLDANTSAQMSLVNDLAERLGSIGCKLSQDQIQQNIDSLKA